MEAQEDELTHRETEFRDYYFDDELAESSSGIVEGSYMMSADDIEAAREIEDAKRYIESRSLDQIRDYRDEDAPPNAWLSQTALDRAARELSLVTDHGARVANGTGLDASTPALPVQEQGMPKGKEDAKFFCTVSQNPNCPRFRDKLEQIVGELQAEKTHTEHLLETTKTECAAQLKEMDTQINQMNDKQNEGARIESEVRTMQTGSKSQRCELSRVPGEHQRWRPGRTLARGVRPVLSNLMHLAQSHRSKAKGAKFSTSGT
mmetsp:Transcript_54153/g.144268  ORF Transcript_54153/g.144268 Transcript_54153/m.144268 type:complete len:262 (+) Transcript_54153:1055-1840(+)